VGKARVLSPRLLEYWQQEEKNNEKKEKKSESIGLIYQI
jgi:hypothetical protein